jgi:hypothetical protein
MEKFLRFIPAVFFSAYFFKVLIKGAMFVDAPVLLILAILAMYTEYKLRDARLLAIEAKVAASLAEVETQKKEIEQLKNHVAAVKMGHMRVPNVGR